MDYAKAPKMMIFGGIPDEEPFITTSENRENTRIAIRDWMLGPEKPSNERGANKVYWVALGKAMHVNEAEAQLRRAGVRSGGHATETGLVPDQPERWRSL